jgi:hypothetical protein
MLTTQAPGANGVELVAVQFDRVGGRAWTLAVWMMEDQQLAADVVVETFTPLEPTRRRAAGDDASLLCDLRRRAIATVPARAGPGDGGTADAITSLPEEQRAVIELVLRGRLDVAAIAAATMTPRAEVITSLAAAARTLEPMVERAPVSAPAAPAGRRPSPRGARSASARSEG